MSYLILFDIREADNTTRLKVNKSLRKLGAEMIQQSVWELDKYSKLEELAEFIRSANGSAMILEKEIIG